MKFFSPTFRSRRFGHRLLTARVVMLVGLFTWLTPALVGIIALAVFSVVLPVHDFDSPWAVVGATSGLLIFAPVYGVILVPFGLLIGAWAMQFGIAGWASALVACFVIPLAIGGLFQWVDPTGQALGALALMIPVTLVHASAMWIATRYLCPQSLMDWAASNASP